MNWGRVNSGRGSKRGGGGGSKLVGVVNWLH